MASASNRQVHPICSHLMKKELTIPVYLAKLSRNAMHLNADCLRPDATPHAASMILTNLKALLDNAARLCISLLLGKQH